VTFGSNAATNVSVVSGTQISATTPAGKQGRERHRQPIGRQCRHSGIRLHVCRASTVWLGGPNTGADGRRDVGDDHWHQLQWVTAVKFGATVVHSWPTVSRRSWRRVRPVPGGRRDGDSGGRYKRSTGDRFTYTGPGSITISPRAWTSAAGGDHQSSAQT